MGKGFTFIEIVILVVLIGILSAISIPKFIDLRTDAKLASVAGSVAVLRSSINNQYVIVTLYGYAYDALNPGEFPTQGEVDNNFMNRDNGNYTSNIVVGLTPENVFDGDGDPNNVVNASGFGRGAIVNTDGGWAYNPTSGEIWANTDVAGENYL